MERNVCHLPIKGLKLAVKLKDVKRVYKGRILTSTMTGQQKSSADESHCASRKLWLPNSYISFDSQ